jgi:hypothetical protein
MTHSEEAAVVVPHAVMTGPITGTVTLADGTEYDVSPELIQVASGEHQAEVAHLIAQRYITAGHPSDPDFIYVAPEKEK